MWCIPKLTAEFIKQMFDVLEVYERTFDPKKPVVCIDEKSKQLLKDSRASILGKRGRLTKKGYEYKRNGTCNIFVAIEPKGKRRKVKVTKHRGKKDYALFIKFLVDKVYRRADKIILVEDNLNTHNEASLIETFGEKTGKRISAKIEWHWTPKHASWLNQAEIEIHALGQQCLNRRIGTFQQIQSEVSACVRKRNEDKCGVNWQFTRIKAGINFRLV